MQKQIRSLLLREMESNADLELGAVGSFHRDLQGSSIADTITFEQTINAIQPEHTYVATLELEDGQRTSTVPLQLIKQNSVPVLSGNVVVRERSAATDTSSPISITVNNQSSTPWILNACTQPSWYSPYWALSHTPAANLAVFGSDFIAAYPPYSPYDPGMVLELIYTNALASICAVVGLQITWNYQFNNWGYKPDWQYLMPGGGFETVVPDPSDSYEVPYQDAGGYTVSIAPDSGGSSLYLSVTISDPQISFGYTNTGSGSQSITLTVGSSVSTAESVLAGKTCSFNDIQVPEGTTVTLTVQAQDGSAELSAQLGMNGVFACTPPSSFTFLQQNAQVQITCNSS